MDEAKELERVLKKSVTISEVDEHIYSVLPNSFTKPMYESRGAIYDFIVATEIYNRVMWGDSPKTYRTFAEEAVQSSESGLLLDAACGSMLFTASIFVRTKRPIIACDQSVDMLRRARARLLSFNSSFPEHVILLHADLRDMPFAEKRFRTILCMNFLHHYEDASGLLSRFKSMLCSNGQLYMTSLALNKRLVGDGYLNMLHAQGWFVQPRNTQSLKSLYCDSFNHTIRFWTNGNMSYFTTMAQRN